MIYCLDLYFWYFHLFYFNYALYNLFASSIQIQFILNSMYYHVSTTMSKNVNVLRDNDVSLVQMVSLTAE